MAKFAVCIPVYNGADFIAQALESVADQTLTDLEVVVSDNASTDQTADILESWSRRLPMRIVRREKTLPIIDHFNALLDEVDSDRYMILCDDDYLARPDALSLANEALEAHPDISAVYCDLVYVSETRRRLASRRFGRRGRFDGAQAGRQSLRTARNCFGIPLAVRRSALGALRYDANLRYAGDLDLSWCVSSRSPAFHIGETLIANRYGGTNSTWSMLAQAKSEFLYIAEKHGVSIDSLDRARLGMTCFRVAQQKRLFGAYAGLVS